MSRYGVIGQPVAHSLSPRIHALFAKAFGIDLSYEAIEIAPADLAARLQQLHADGYSGINVTLPHKAVVAALCEGVSERAQIAGAVNCLKRTDSGWIGDNTDGEGLVRDLARLGIAVAGQRVLLLGAGGAARGAIDPLLALHPKELVVSSRNPWKPEALAEQFKGRGPLRPCTHLALKGDHYDLIINATSAGHAGGMPRLPGPLLVEGGSCYDLSYGKAHAPFAAWAQQQSAAKTDDGLGMLVEQAAVSFEIWLGKSPDVEAVLAALRTR
ncbi:shikimate dehydrogenase [Hydrocarboniphaga sp.]|uniref:shikimate dehydrogenase n=1 Tax=Hydrocarboniphaga sp. TaxID=2033016 RepID=UPI003451AE85